MGQPMMPATHQDRSLEPVGLIGLGRMGLPMAERLKATGREVHVYRRRDTPNIERWRGDGGALVDTIAGLADCRTVILSLPTTDDVRSVAWTLLDALQPGALILDTSTIHPAGARAFAALAQQRGLAWLDAPVSGGPAGAAAGTLAVMVGGAESDFARARPLLEDLGKTIVHFGDSGSGLVCKLANNTLLAVSAVATCEALVLVTQAGLDARRVLDVLSASSGYNKFMDTRGKVLAQTGTFGPAQFTVNMLLKDLRVALDACADIGFTPDTLRTALSAFERAVEAGLGEQDFSAILRVVEARAGVTIP